MREQPALSERINHEKLIALLASEFPEVVECLSKYDRGLLHCEVAVLWRLAEEAIDGGRLWKAEYYFRFVDRVLSQADDEVENALLVSFLEDFALGEFTRARYDALKDRMPASLRKFLIEVDDKWR